MRISFNFHLYSLNENSTIFDCLNLLKLNGGYPISIVGKNNIFMGIVTNTSIRNAYFKKISPKSACRNIIQRNCITARDIDNKETLSGFFINSKKEYKLIPLLTNECILHSFALNLPPVFEIRNQCITKDVGEAFLIAEIGVNHNGSVDNAISLVDAAKNAGFDAVKLQCRSSKTYNEENISNQELSVQYIKQELDKNNLEQKKEEQLITYIKKSGLKLILTPFDETALLRVMSYKPDAIKIASADATNYLLLEEVSKTKLPIILSTGMCFESEIIDLINWCNKNLTNFAILHCNSTYPTPPEDVHLIYIRRLSELASCVVGYSSHDYDSLIPALSICYGARIIETHITKDKTLPGTDHLASIEIKNLKHYVKQVKQIVRVHGVSLPRTPSQGELSNKLVLGKSLCFKSNLKKGDTVTLQDLELRSPGDGIFFKDRKKIIEKKLYIDVKAGTQAKLSDVNNKKGLIKKIDYPLLEEVNWGLPVRFRDISNLLDICDPKIIEFHLSSNDLDFDYRQLLSKLNLVQSRIVIHAIEQYSDGFILNLCSSDTSEREESIKRVKKVIKISKDLSSFCPKMNTSKVPIVINIGGFSRNNFLSNEESDELFDNGCKSLEELMSDSNEIEFIPQSMPPFPWFQGGSAFHNIMCSTKDIKLLKKRLGLNITLDISHSALYCNYKEIDIIDFVSSIIPEIAHIHLADASQNGEEGLQLGFGDMPLLEIIQLLKNNNMLRKTSTVLEIWQGHLNNFNGFTDGLEILSSLMDLNSLQNK